MLNSSITRIAFFAVLCCGLPKQAEAGPLIDWLFGRTRAQAAYPVGPPVPTAGYGANYGGYSVSPNTANPYAPNPYTANSYGAGYGVNGSGSNYGANYGTTNGNYSATANPQGGYAANYGTYYGSSLPVIGPNGAGYQAAQPSGIAAATMPGTIPQTLSYVPNFNTYSNRTPVTYYRPLLTTDPNTGAQVVAMAPCTSYEYQAQRVPAFGRSALFGSNSPPFIQSAPQALPTYTLPSGGIPLAAGTPSVMLPTVRGYAPYGSNPYASNGYPSSSYGALQPAMPSGPIQVAPGGSYSTQPLGNSTYYGSTSGGSSGNIYGPSVPGLIAPQGPAYPATPTPNYNSPYPGTTSPGQLQSPGVYPGAPSTDPADIPPSLSPNFPTSTSAQLQRPAQSNQTQEFVPPRVEARPQLRSIVRQPIPNSSSTTGTAAPAERAETPVLMKPIPVPEGFEQPRWNPGLLSEDDMTAMQPISADRVAIAGQSKPIHWASFDQAGQTSFKAQADISQTSSLKPQSGLRPIRTQATTAAPQDRPAPHRSRYDTGGWKAAK